MKNWFTPSRWFPLLSCLALLTLATAHASGQNASPGPERLTLTQTVEPSFRIEPVVHRFNGRRGEVIPFEFLIGSMGKEMEVTVQPVNLRQEETGIILHDDQGDPASAMRLSSPQRFKLGPGRQSLIKGSVTVPLAKSNYLSYGLLVREAGEKPNFDKAGDAPTRAGIRFVTQYVLRVDVETGIADVGSLKDLRLERGTLVSDRGLPRVQSFLRNPTAYAFECFVSAQIAANVSRRDPSMRLGMLSRATLDGDERYLIRIMPNSTLRLESPVEQVLAPGEQSLRLSLTGGRREVSSAEFALNIRDTDFPALAQKRAVINGVSVEPAQIEIGTVRSASRTLGLKFRNAEEQPARIELAPQTLDGSPLDGVRFSPSSFTLKPGRTKGVRAMLRKTDSQAIEAGVALVRWSREGAEDRVERLPLSVLNAEPGDPSLEVSDIAWSGSAAEEGFVVDVTNHSEAYCPVSGELLVGGPGLPTHRLEAGYGKWIAPGQTVSLAFRPQGPVPAGDYGLILTIRHREGFAPIVRELNVTLNGETTTAANETADAGSSPG